MYSFEENSTLKAEVTVIMSVFNERPNFLLKSVHSITEQTFTNLLLIIINDGSTDSDTLNTLEGLKKADRRIEVLNKPHTGLTDSLNTGLLIADSEFIARQDSDDWSEPERIQLQIAELKNNPVVGVIGSNVLLHRENSIPLWSTDLPRDSSEIQMWFSKSLNPFCHGAVMFRKECAVKVGMYRTEFKSAQDFDFFSRLCEVTQGMNLKSILYHYRYTAGAISSQRVAEQLSYHHMGFLLFQQRNSIGKEDFSVAKETTKKYIATQISALSAIKADRALLAGHTGGAFVEIIYIIFKHPCDVKNYLRAFRMLLFIFFPPLRKRLFLYGK